jgi:hypothetical protein
MELITLSMVSLPFGGKNTYITTNGSAEHLAQQLVDAPVETINDLLLSKVHEGPKSVFISYPATVRGQNDYIDYTVSEIDEFADEAARKYVASGIVTEVS